MIILPQPILKHNDHRRITNTIQWWFRWYYLPIRQSFGSDKVLL